MRINLNNRFEDFQGEQLTVSELLQIKNFTFRLLVIKINDKLIRKEDYGSALISDGDKVVVMHLVSGG
ncbi:MAG: sulfur carrier protein ThiS [Bacteroidetes bacterium]|nr:sulfur carrier protein ThiS [Bacteroidota bacterium]